MDASETTTEVLRAAIETALRRRDPKVCVRVEPVASRFVASVETTSDEGVCSGVLGDTADEALRRLARGVGLRPDGSDPAEEVERLREREASHAAEMERVIAVATEGVRRTEREALDHYAAAKRRMEASRDDARADLAQLAKQQQRLMTTLGEQTAEIARLRTDNARLDDVAKSALDDLARVRAEFDAARASLDRAHHGVREYGPRCSHPECDALAPLRCDDCGRRFCDEHDDGLAGHDPGFGPQAHAVGPDDLMAGAAMRAAVRS